MTPDELSITLFRGFPAAPRYTWSPFVNKLEFRLRAGGVSYRNDAGSPMSAPRGKIPYVKMTAAGQPDEVLGDSQLIVQNLINKGAMTDLNLHLSPVDKAVDLSVRALIEEKIYFLAVHERWVENYYVMRDEVLSPIPYPMRLIVGLIAYRGVTGALHGQGTLRLSGEEISQKRQEGWDGVNALLVEAKKNSRARKTGEHPVFWLLGGEEPTEVDATLYGSISSSLVCAAAPKQAALLKTYPVILEYARNIHKRYFPEYDIWDT